MDGRVIPGVYPETAQYDQPGWCCICQETAPFYDEIAGEYFCGSESCWNQYLTDTHANPVVPEDDAHE